MSEPKSGEQNWAELLIRNGVPERVAIEAVTGVVNLKWGVRFGLIYVAVMVMLMGAVSLLVVILAGMPCDGDFALNSGVTLLIGLVASITAAGVIVGRAQERAPPHIKKSTFVGAFANPQNLPYARLVAMAVSKRVKVTTDFVAYEAEFNRATAPWFQWPTIVLGVCMPLTYFLVPPICL